MACGLSCVVTAVGDSAAIVGDLGVVVPPGDPEALAQGCRRALERLATFRGPDGAANRQRIELSFSVNRLAERTMQALGLANPCAAAQTPAERPLHDSRCLSK
jgi:glycosyltransferase involved in cell wall biosynthesis